VDANSEAAKELEAWVKREVDTFFKRLETPQPLLAAILQFHLIVENLLERYIICKLGDGYKVINRAQLTFHQKLVLVDSFGEIDDSLIQAMSGLNKLRNRCAHEGGAAISINDIDGIGRICKEYNELKLKKSDDLQALTIALFAHLIYSKMLSKLSLLEVYPVITARLAKGSESS